MDFPITLGLIAANVILSLIAFSNQDFYAKSLMWPYGVKRYNQFYRFISSGFIHADWMHLIFNMLTLFFFGRNVEMFFNGYGLGGNISYLLLYFTGLIISDLPTYFKQKDNYNYHSLGASGAVSAVLFSSIVFDPWSGIIIYFIQLSGLLYAILYLVYCVYAAKRGGDNINHEAHFWGAMYGILFTIALIAVMQPGLFEGILEQLKNPSLFGR